MKVKPIIDSSIVGRTVDFDSSELFAIYNLVTKLEVLALDNSLYNVDKESIKQAIGLLSNIIDKNAMNNLLYNPCPDIFTYQENGVDLATWADKQNELKYGE